MVSKESVELGILYEIPLKKSQEKLFELAYH